MNDPLVVQGVSCWFIVACIAQTAWSPAFAYEYMLLAAVFMGCILVPLVAIVVDQYNIVTSIIDQQSSNNSTHVSWKDYLLLQFPFEIHLGWIAAAFALNINVLVVASGASAKTQCAVAGVSLAILTIVSGACFLRWNDPNIHLFWLQYGLR